MITKIRKAKNLRKNGFSYREIAEKLSISKSTSYIWTNDEKLNNFAKEKIKKKIDNGRKKGQETNKKKQQNLWKKIERECGILKNGLNKKDFSRIILAVLFWSEGEKIFTRLNFINSDPEMIKFYLKILRNNYSIKEEKFRVVVHLHEYHNEEEIINFWSKLTDIGKNFFSVYNKAHTGKNKKPGYKGCLSIRYHDSVIAKELFVIIERLKNINIIAGLV